MKWDALEDEPCSLARTVAVIGDRWSLLILRECFLRIRRFDEFQASMFDPVMVCSECGEPLTAKAVHVHPGPGARRSSPVHAKAQERAKRGIGST